MKPGLYDRLRALPRARIAPDTGPMTGSFSKQQPSTIRGEAHTPMTQDVVVVIGSDERTDGRFVSDQRLSGHRLVKAYQITRVGRRSGRPELDHGRRSWQRGD